MNALALDLGTDTGFAFARGDEVCLGTWKLATRDEIKLWGKSRLTRRNDPRVARLLERLQPFQDWVNVVCFEDVEFSSYTLQVQLWSALRSAVWIAFAGPRYHMECVPVTTLKKFATGHGAATKEMMIAAAQKKFPSLCSKNGADHNAIDALHLLSWTMQSLRLSPTQINPLKQ